MMMTVKTNGATDLVINLPVEKVGYVQDMIRLFENNVVAVSANSYSENKIVELDTVIQVGKSVVFKGSEYSSTPEPDLIISTGESSDILEHYEALLMDSYISVKEQMKKLKDSNATLKKENDYLKDKIERLQEINNTLEDNLREIDD